MVELNQGDLEYPTNLTKFSSVNKLIIGFDGTFGASKSSVKFVGLKGERLRNKTKIGETVYEVRANLADHKVPGEEEKGFGGLGM